jgi:hypothetical protein
MEVPVFMSRLISFVLVFAMAGCAQHSTPLIPTDSQSTMPSAAKPADSLTANVTLRNESGDKTEFTVYWSYAINPIWHVEATKCLEPGQTWNTQVVYHPGKFFRGPQIRFEAAVFSFLHKVCAFPEHVRTLTFHGINFTPDAHFHGFVDRAHGGIRFCAHGGGNKEICDWR